LVADIRLSEDYVLDSQEVEAFSLSQQFFFRANLGKDKGASFFAGVQLTCLIRRMGGLD